MDRTKLQEIEDSIRSASPLDLAKKLQEAELYDQKETRAVVDEVYAEFEKCDKEKSIIEPIFLSIIDGFLESSKITRKLRKKGLTASRIVAECQAFSYDQKERGVILPDGYVEWKNVNDFKNSLSAKNGVASRQEFDRELYEDKARLNVYKQQKFDEIGNKINATDEYTGQNNVYQYKDNPDARRNIEKYKHDHQAVVDHIVPLKQIHEQLKDNYTLSNDDIKRISNDDSNYALTSARINGGVGASGQGGKFDKTNTEFINDQNSREQEGRPNLYLSDEAKENMFRMEKKAQKAIFIEASKQTGKVLSANAAKQSADYVVGNVMLYLIKPIYYEIADIFKNGMEEGVEADSTMEAFRIRFGRVKKYVMDNALAFFGDNVLLFIKGFISSLIEGIISLFVGIFKQVLKLVKEGVKIFIQAGKVLFGKESSQMTAAQRGDAIIKIIGGSVITICGIGIEALMNKIGIPDPWSVVLSTMLSGIASALFMHLLDKIDLFSVKAEQRRMRIEEIFDARIKDIKDAEESFDNATLEVMRQQKLQFVEIQKSINGGIVGNNIDTINMGLFKLASFMNVDLGYTNQGEFVNGFDGMVISL